MSKSTLFSKDTSPQKIVKKQLVKSALSNSSLNSTSNPQFDYLTQISQNNINDHGKGSTANKSNQNLVAYQAQTSNGLPSFYASISANNSTGAASSILNGSTATSHFTLSNSPTNENNQSANSVLESFDFKTTVGTGTFGRVICGKKKIYLF